MSISKFKILNSLSPISHNLLRYCHSTTTISSHETLQETIKDSVMAEAYQNLPELLTSFDQAQRKPNLFSFLSNFPEKLRTQVINEILQSLAPLRPRSRAQVGYMCLLFHTLETLGSVPHSLTVLQQTLRSGSAPASQTHLLLSSSWIENWQRNSHSVQKILSDMKFVAGYILDSGTCNYLLSSLCGVDQLAEAVKVLKGMAGAGCVPDSESYDVVIKALCRFRRTAEAVERLREMVERAGLTPRQGTLVRVGSALRANREMWRAVEVIEFLEGEVQMVGFEFYELVSEGCREYILAGKVVIRIIERGLLLYIAVRQKADERSAVIGESKIRQIVILVKRLHFPLYVS